MENNDKLDLCIIRNIETGALMYAEAGHAQRLHDNGGKFRIEARVDKSDSNINNIAKEFDNQSRGSGK